MRVIFQQSMLERIDSEGTFTGSYPPAAVSAYRGRIQVIRAAPQEEVMLQLRSLQMERRGNGTSQHSVRVTDDWELIVAFEDSEDGRVAVVQAMVERKKTEHPL